MQSHPVTGIRLVAPSLVVAGEPFAVNIKVLTEPYVVDWAAGWDRVTPQPISPFNRSPRPGFSYLDNVPKRWNGTVRLTCDRAFVGPETIPFGDGHGPCGSKDHRPIRRIADFEFATPGTYFLTATDMATGISTTSNPILVEPELPGERLFWGDLHSQTIFSDGLRCPEELCAFARDEGFLDIFALSDHVEALTDQQWDYFCAVINDFNQPGRFATLLGQEWTNHRPQVGAPGHRNIYYRGDHGPIIRCTDSRYDTLEKLYAVAKETNALLIPHHSASVAMGVDWAKGHDPEHERLVEIHSVWGNSERPAAAGNPLAILVSNGECSGQHVVDALNLGRRFGMVGGGDIHDGRPGDELHRFFANDKSDKLRQQGIMAVWADELSREAVFDALWNRRCYATTNNRTLLRFAIADQPMGATVECARTLPVHIQVASESPIARLDLVRNGKDLHSVEPNTCSLTLDHDVRDAADNDWYMVRVTRADGGMAWSSPIWVENR